ncbi:MAG: GNAT family N-acetyltransferase, partial [Candidatus Thorarchaeota archaeon]
FVNIFFRKLKSSDIPQINEISRDIWEGDDYVPSVIENWLKQENCLNYGAFEDFEKTILIGFGRVRYYPNGLAWLEGGRVRTSYQQKGIGRQLIQYALDEAKKAGAIIAQYDTSSRNQGSIALARGFGFKVKKKMELMVIKPLEIQLELKSVNESKIERIDALRASNLLKTMDIGPGNEICTGWSYTPLEFLSENEFTWLQLHNSVLFAFDSTSNTKCEKPNKDELWMITYGEPAENMELIKYLIIDSIKNCKYKIIVAFCQFETAKLIQILGFKYENNEPYSVILFEKQI